MTLLASGALWLLGLGGIVAAVYFLKRQAQPQYVSSLLFWRGVERQPRSALRFNKMPLLGLILQLLALLAVVLALAQPVLHTSASGARTLALVIDGSASMRAEMTPDGERRYEAAIARANEILADNPAAEAALFSAQRNSELLVQPTTDHATIRRVLGGYEPTYQADADPASLLRLIESQFPSGVDRVVVLSDQAASAQTAVLGWQTEIVGSEEPMTNLAVTSFEARTQPNNQGVAFVTEVWNGSEVERAIPVRIRSANTTLAEQTLTVPANGTADLDVSRSNLQATQFVAEIAPGDAPDARADDNVRYATLPQKRPWQVQWIGEESFYLSRFFERAGRAEVFRQGEAATGSSDDGADLTLVHKARIDNPQPGRYLLVAGTVPPWITGTEGTSGGRVVIEQNHPTLQGLAPDDWRLGDVPSIDVAPDGETLLSVGGEPVLYLVASGGVRLAYLGIDLSQANLGLSVDFPILLFRLMEWLAPRVDRASTLTVGDELPLDRLDAGTQITDPDGRTCQLGQGNAECGRLDEPGIYRVTEGSNTYYFAANAPAAESTRRVVSDTATPTPASTSSSSASPTRSLESMTSLWPWALALGVGLLFAELWAFDRPRWLALGRRDA